MTAPSTASSWRKPRRSQNGNNCVEVALAPTEVGVRDTKDRDSGQLSVTSTAWRALIKNFSRE
ncbi:MULTISPECIES: DUF397 domain-containing protein [unclassified Amycolatopsis]|uniref:DUF397 domain-containing protein n=1 Tax=unclassified Amycolatopsis TaxID=2618356 RepID=UPI001C69C548|nr:DUF397 domain-containing protein [Amycolatopsis sp. DSM 110486]QYN20168.1 DUF397 domain-containing protein [Amycolatopsis sp. DSM 110486]